LHLHYCPNLLGYNTVVGYKANKFGLICAYKLTFDYLFAAGGYTYSGTSVEGCAFEAEIIDGKRAVAIFQYGIDLIRVEVALEGAVDEYAYSSRQYLEDSKNDRSA